jgi:hypothetical protein
MKVGIIASLLRYDFIAEKRASTSTYSPPSSGALLPIGLRSTGCEANLRL